LLAVLAVLATLSGCGSGEISGEIPQENAQDLNAALEDVRTAVESGPQGCTEADSAADQFVDEVNALPADPAAELKAELQAAAHNLRTLVDNQCASTGTPDTTSPTTTPTTEPTTTEPTTTEPTTTEPTTEEPPPPGNGNGPPGNGPPGNGPPGNGPPGGDTDGGTGGTGGGNTGDETGD
jgi:hypothetical protein